MINGEKIGVGIVTCGRPELFKKLFDSLQSCKEFIDHLAICEDTLIPNPDHNNYIIGEDKGDWKSDGTLYAITTDENMGVGKSKNNCLRHLISKECEHIFLIEDDIFIKDPSVFERYIKASKVSGIQHFNFSQHGMMNKTFDAFRSPNPRFSVNYTNDITVALYPHCVGAFSYYSQLCLHTAGYIDEDYHNACEHVDHTYEISKAGMHPPFWWFADIENSWEYLGDEEWSIAKSTISSNPKHQQMMADADKIFVKKHGHLPVQTPQNVFEVVGKQISQIKKMYGE